MVWDEGKPTQEGVEKSVGLQALPRRFASTYSITDPFTKRYLCRSDINNTQPQVF